MNGCDLRLTDYDLKPGTRNAKLAILDFRRGLETGGYLEECDHSIPDPRVPWP